MTTYVDTSVVLAALFAEDRRPPAAFWAQHLVASRLLEYETWVRVHAAAASPALIEAARLVTGSVGLVEMTPQVLSRAVEPFPARLRTLDVLHLATADYLREQGMRLRFATYDSRLRDAANTLRFDVIEP